MTTIGFDSLSDETYGTGHRSMTRSPVIRRQAPAVGSSLTAPFKVDRAAPIAVYWPEVRCLNDECVESRRL